jgi:penicillin amidase
MLGAIDWTDPALVKEISAAVSATLDAALSEIEGLLGPDRADWAWGRLHQTLMIHPALTGIDGVPHNWAQVGPAPKPGSGDTVGNAGYDANFHQTLGSTFRVVIDVGNWDASQAMNSPGQSGDPRSPHYADLFGPWSKGGSFPLLYSREAVEQHTETRIVLRPHG